MYKRQSPACADKIYCVPGYLNSNLYALDKYTGQEAWTKGPRTKKSKRIVLPYPYAMRIDLGRDISRKASAFTYVSSPAVGPNAVYAVIGSKIYAYSRTDGSLLWSANIGSPSSIGYASSPVVTDNVVWVASAGGLLYAFNASNGTLLGSFELGGGVVSSPAVSSEAIYLTTFDGRVLKTQTSPTGILSNLPRYFALYQNYPNPFRKHTNIKFAIPYTGSLNRKVNVRLAIYNVMGQRVCELLNEPKAPGYYTIKWDGRDARGRLLPAGIYFYRIEAGKFTSTKKLVRIK